MTVLAFDPQVRASDPAASVFVTANAGSGKTSTLVKRVARLLLRDVKPEAILCVTYTKAAAAEMQRRLFDELGDWAVMADAPLAKTLLDLNEQPANLSDARALFARALETPGGLKIQTIHAFCEKLLRRFPLEAGVSPGFKVLEDAAARKVSAQARDDLAAFALADGFEALGRAYAHFSVELDWRNFNAMFDTFEARRGAIEAYVVACEEQGGLAEDVWRRCGFAGETLPEDLEAGAIADIDWQAWRWAADALLQGTPASDQPLGRAMKAMGPDSTFADIWSVFATQAGEPRVRLGTKSVDAAAVAWMAELQGRLNHERGRAKAARIARDTVHALTLARAYASLYEAAKAAQGGLDFGDLIARTYELLTIRADAAWVLYKLDGGIDHVLLDEAQDTAPSQWDILHALTDEFFAGTGADVFYGRRLAERAADRTLFAVGDDKQSIYSFQGADPARFLAERGDYQSIVESAGGDFRAVPLEDSWRSAPEVLALVDAVFADPEAARGLRPGADTAEPVRHIAKRPAGGGVDLWPLEISEPAAEVDPWLPVDAELSTSANKKLAGRIAREIRRMIDDGDAVVDKQSREPRPITPGDVLILVRRRNALFHEIIRALKREAVAVGGADRLRLSDHIVFQDLVALGRFARYPDDDLTLAALLRSPFCEVDDPSLFDLANPRPFTGRLWPELVRRANERPEWRQALDFLTWASAEASARTPFDFYGRVLSRLDGTGRSMRQRLLTRLGREAEDAIDAFLAEALNAEAVGVRDLERFLARMAASEIEVKREQEDTSGRGGGEVRVMTAHGAKGLEAPVVILPDTSTRAGAMGGPLLDAEGGGFLWAPRKQDDCEASADAREARETASAFESLRLLYVAMTRARDRLIVCGVETQKARLAGSWYDYVARAFERPEIAAESRGEVVEDAHIVRYGAEPVILIAPRADLTAEHPLPGLGAASGARRIPCPTLRLALDPGGS